MGSDGDFEGAVERLKLAAVDAFMCGKSGGGGGNSQIVYDPDYPTLSYYITTSGRYVRPEGVSEEKGGMRVEDSVLHGKKMEPSWASEEFESIRNWIEEIVDRWRDTPDLRQIDDLIARFGEVSVNFRGDITDPDGHVGRVNSLFYQLDNVNQAVFDDNFDGVHEEAEGLQGEGFDCFKGYFQGLLDAVSACDEVVQVLGGAIATERALWEIATERATKTISETADACDTVAKGSTAHLDVDDILSILSLGFGITSCVPSPVQAPAGVISVVLSMVTTGRGLSDEEFRAIDYVQPTPDPIPTHSGAIDVLSHLLNGSVAGVDQQVTATEDAIQETLSTAVAEIYSPSRGRRFDPVAGPITEAIRTDPTRANTIVNGMNELAGLLDSTVTRIQDCLDLPASTMRRHARIGIGPDGPYPSVVELLELLQQLLMEMRDEAYAAAENFRISQEVLYQADDAAQETLRQAARDFRSADAFTYIDARRFETTLIGMPRIGRF